jgi:hypothetical protein
MENVSLIAAANRISSLRDTQIMLDRDLAELYQVTTKALNQAVKRNIERFPGNFMFRLTIVEKEELVTNCDLQLSVFIVYLIIECLKSEGIKTIAFGEGMIRFVTHLDIDQQKIDYTLEKLKKLKITQ